LKEDFIDCSVYKYGGSNVVDAFVFVTNVSNNYCYDEIVYLNVDKDQVVIMQLVSQEYHEIQVSKVQYHPIFDEFLDKGEKISTLIFVDLSSNVSIYDSYGFDSCESSEVDYFDLISVEATEDENKLLDHLPMSLFQVEVDQKFPRINKPIVNETHSSEPVYDTYASNPLEGNEGDE
jgi:hypothetical protein